MDPQERYDRFLSALGFRAGVADTSTPGVEVTDFDGDPVEPSVHLHVDPGTLADHVGPVPEESPAEEDDDEDSADDREAARLQTLLAQIEEAILVRGAGYDHLVLVPGGVRAVRAGDVAA